MYVDWVEEKQTYKLKAKQLVTKIVGKEWNGGKNGNWVDEVKSIKRVCQCRVRFDGGLYDGCLCWAIVIK